MESKFVKITNKEEWQGLLNKVLFKTFFHNIEWEEFLEKQFKWLKFERYNYQNKALLSLAKAGRKLISHPFCEYGGPLPLVERINIDEFQKDLFSEFKERIKISFHPQILKYLENLKIISSQRETYFYENIQDPQLWQRMDRNRHRSIESAQDQNFQTEKCQSKTDLNKLYHLYAKDLRRYKVVPYPFSFFEYFFNSPQAKVILVEKNKKVVGGNIFLTYNKIFHSFLCGFEDKFKKSGIHSLVIWEAVKMGQAEGFEHFDFGGTKKGSSIGDFKLRWGAKALPIYELKNYSGESTLKDSFLRDAWSCLPVSLIKILSPYFIKYKL